MQRRFAVFELWVESLVDLVGFGDFSGHAGLHLLLRRGFRGSRRRCFLLLGHELLEQLRVLELREVLRGIRDRIRRIVVLCRWALVVYAVARLFYERLLELFLACGH